MFVMLPYLSAHFLIGYCFVSRDNLQMKRAVYPLCSLYTAGFQICDQGGAPPTFFRVDSITLNTPHTTEKSER